MGLDDVGFESWHKQRFCFLFKTFLPSGPHSTWYYLPRIKRPGSKFDHSLPSIAKIKNGLNCKSALPYALTPCIWEILFFNEIISDPLQCDLEQFVYPFVIKFLF
jgi:hypothetical protein